MPPPPSLPTSPTRNLQGIRDFQELTFSEWLDAITTYCLFEEEDILRFCFFILDREKNGYIEKDELRMLVNMLYNIDPVKGPTGNTKVAFEKLSVQQDGKIEFWEFELFNKAFPSLFFPAFRLQVGVYVPMYPKPTLLSNHTDFRSLGFADKLLLV